MLAGLLSHVGSRDEVKREYLGARGARFGISPGSSLFRKQPQFVMAGELVETTRLWARDVARIDPLWAEEAGEHLVKRSYSEPRWSAKQGSAVATERVTLYGVPIVLARTVGYARVDAAESRHLFIQRALVEGDWTTRHRFFHDNVALVERLSELEAGRGVATSSSATRRCMRSTTSGFLPRSCRRGTSTPGGRRPGVKTPTLLTFTEDLLLSDRADQVDTDAYPTVWRQGDLDLAVTYRFEPGSPEDGVTVHVPVEVLNRVTAVGFDWQVNSLREDLVTALIRSPAQGDPATAGARAGARRGTGAGAARARARP